MKLVDNPYGRTNEFILKKVKWIKIEQRYQMCIQKVVHKLLNHDNKNRHFLATILTLNRNVRKLSENKCGPRTRIERSDKFSNKNFTNKAMDIYNKVPRELSLLKDNNKFKKCIIKYTLIPTIVFRIVGQNDYNEEQLVDFTNIVDPPCNIT